MRRLRDSQPLAVKAIVPAKTANDHEKQESLFSLALVEHLRIIVELNTEESVIQEIARRMTATLRRGGKILFCGNGGSAADAQHLAAELVGRFQAERRGLAAIALTTDSSVLTSIANDYGYEEVFRRQVEALACPGDMLIGLSTSGESDNVCAAITAARLMDVYTVALCGKGGSRLAELADLALIVPSDVTARIQEAHIFCGHVLCACVEAALNEEAAGSEVGESLMSRKQTWAQERDVARSEGAATLSVVERRQADTATLPSTTPPSRPKPGQSGWQMRDDTHSNQADTRGKWL